MLWVGLGVVSLLLAAALGLATSRLTEAPVGLSAEPVSAGEALAPQPDAAPTATREPAEREPAVDSTPTATPAGTAVPPVETEGSDDNSGSGSDESGDDDSSGRGRGRGRGRGGDDD